MKKIAFVVSLVLALALLTLATVAHPRSTEHNSQAAVVPHSQDPGQSQAQTFTGKITKSNGKYALEDSSKNTTYYLDDSKNAEKYEGKNVKVTGTLDAANNTIHVQKIEEA